MKKLILIALACASLTCAQTVSITIAGVAPAIIADIHTHWLDQAESRVATTTAPIDGTSSTITITLSATQQGSPILPVGKSALIGGEPMIVSSVSGQDVTFLRGTLPLAAKAAHDAGAAVYILKYATPWDMLIAEAVRPWVQSVTAQLGARSATFSGTFTGTVTQ